MIKRAFFLAFLMAVLPFTAWGEGPSAEPILRIETGMHTAMILNIAADSAGRFLVTGSVDKTVRIWDLGNGALLRTLRLPIGEGFEGEVHAVAMSPDGRLVAVSSPAGVKSNIYLFGRETGKLVHRIGDLPLGVIHLSFSPDGRKLAAAILSFHGVQLFRVADGQRVGQDGSYGAEAFGFDWDQSGRLVTCSWDGYIRLYNNDFQLVKKTKTVGGKKPFTVSFSPDGEKIAVGFHDTVAIDVLASSSLRNIYQPDTSGTPNVNFERVAWSSDGQSLNASGMNTSNNGINLIRRWSDAGRGSFRDLPTGASGTLLGLSALPERRLVFGAADPLWGVLAADGRGTLLVKSGAPELWDPVEFSVDAKAARIRFGYQYDFDQQSAKSFATFSVHERNLVLDTPKDPGLAGPRTEAPRLSISGWKSKTLTPPTLAGKPLPIDMPEYARGLAIAGDGKSFLLSTSGSIYSFDASGKVRWKTFFSGAAPWAVNLSGDGRLAVATFADGTIRWFRADNGKELLAFFPHADRKRWVAWTPSGYYDASVGGEDLIGWHVNRGPDEAADFFPASRFRGRFYRPDVVARVLDTLDEGTAVAQADAEAQRKPETTDFTKLLPPVVTILAPAAETEVREASVAFRVTVRSPSGEPVTAVRAYVDGRPAGSARGWTYEPDPQPADPSAERDYSLAVVVPPRDCTVSIAAETRLATGEPVPVKLRWAAVPPALEKPMLYLLAIGVGTFANPAVDKLDLPAKDARDVAMSWKAQAGGLYREVNAKVLTDAQGTKEAILAGMQWLEQQTTKEDVAILYFSGHGMNDPLSGDYLFFPYEANREDRFKTLLPGSEVQNALSIIPGKVLLFLDTCNSGNFFGTFKSRDAADLTLFINELTSAEHGIVVFSASTGKGQAMESSEWRNGAFTRALLEALAGKADYRDNGLYVTALESYLARRVRELTHDLQIPVTAKPGTIPDFPVAVVRK